MKDFLNLIQKQKNNFYFPLAIISVVVFFILVAVNITLFIIYKESSTQKLNVNLPTIVYYPKLENSQIPDISAQSFIIADADSKKIIASKNVNLHFSPASTTKIMTALIGLNYFKLNQILTIKSSDIPPVVAGFLPNQQLTFESLLYSMMLPSDNDAAIAIADNYPGGQKAFINAMNMKASALHLYNTHYSDPVGLLDDGDYTTPIDLFRLSSFAIKNPVLRQIVSTKEKIISTVDQSASFDLISLNELLGYKGVFGIKTGYTEDAGQVLVTAINKDGHTIIIIVMGSQDRFADTKLLIDNVVEDVNYVPVNL